MNRIKLKYMPGKDGERSILKIYNDIKGYNCEQIGETLYGMQAEVLFNLLTHVDYSKLDEYVNYGTIIVENKEDF